MNRFFCPENGLVIEEKRQLLVSQIDSWINDPHLAKLIELYGGNTSVILSGDILERVKRVQAFSSSIWDYRKKQKQKVTTRNGEAARWKLEDDLAAIQNQNEIYAAASSLGLIANHNTVLDRCDYILSLGGANLSNLARTEASLYQYNHFLGMNPDISTTIIGLASFRPLETDEKKIVQQYTNNSVNYEFDAMTEALKKVYNAEVLEENIVRNTSIARQSAIVKLQSKDFPGLNIFCIAAASSDPEKRRANTEDTLNMFLSSFSISEGASVLNCTSSLYVPQQQLKTILMAINNNFVCDTVGFRHNGQLAKPISYLQEIKATIDAAQIVLSELHSEC